MSARASGCDVGRASETDRRRGRAEPKSLGVASLESRELALTITSWRPATRTARCSRASNPVAAGSATERTASATSARLAKSCATRTPWPPAMLRGKVTTRWPVPRSAGSAWAPGNAWSARLQATAALRARARSGSVPPREGLARHAIRPTTARARTSGKSGYAARVHASVASTAPIVRTVHL